MDTIAPTPLTDDLRTRFAALLPAGRALTEAEAIAPYLREQRDLYEGRSRLVLRPSSVDEVSAILKLANETRTPVVPQGGNTGLVGGQVPRSEQEIVLSLSLMNRIRDVDPIGRTMTVDAGVVLQRVQEAADEANLFFPLSLGSEGSCQIGGNLSSNAGGTGVLAYGNSRDLCLGLEAVLPGGAIFHGLRRLKKDNRGYDIRDLLIGAEGTLGVITGAVLKLFPKPAAREVAYVGLETPEHAIQLLRRAEAIAGSQLTAFELMPRIGIEFTVRHTQGARDPLASPHAWYVLLEISSARSEDDARSVLEHTLEGAFEAGEVQDAAIAQSLSDARMFWRMREEMSWAQKPEGGSIKHDVSVPVALVPEFLRRADEAVLEAIPDARIVSFGHLGDGNIHYNISQPVGADTQVFLGRWHEINRLVHAIVADLNGSFAAEHGIGQLKRIELAETKPPMEMDLMRGIKTVFDPYGIMNPGKLL
ncbi:FAD-binding oxidoreductase [Aureimonas jatrophae]|uniref:FAD/FMN-containing dehydrogenase n=1 Tax=Aureimonas jatrophae TaxID=1166073 RepID=A0A1H0GMT8_9HYPH|nr:FAD-binding oxidoreductase [Aureimonas jatrophae]MBB3949645.1 FAD/FMN-containing dehydrogenase [Aureimonas jatrophae]SDO07991.1 FAD/FMN-containing dehydrogenase [Aureimonas jatrophae]